MTDNLSLGIRSKSHRQHPTPAEAIIWKRLRSGKFLGLKVKRQHRIGDYIVDFYIWRLGMVIEIDGHHHRQRTEYEDARREYLARRGLRVIRFWNTEVIRNTDKVIARIEKEADRCRALIT